MSASTGIIEHMFECMEEIHAVQGGSTSNVGVRVVLSTRRVEGGKGACRERDDRAGALG